MSADRRRVARVLARRSAVTALVAGVLVAVIAFVPSGVRAWIAGVLAAALAASLAAWIPSMLRKLDPVRLRDELDPAGRVPIAVTADILEADYLVSIDLLGHSTMYPVSGHTLRLTVTGLIPGTAVLRGMRPVVLSREAAIGSLRPHAGAIQPRPFDVELDEEPPRVKPAAGKRGRASARFPLSVSLDDPEVLDLIVHTADGVVSWVLDLDWSHRGNAGTLRIDAAGGPFRTAARPGPQSSVASPRASKVSGP